MKIKARALLLALVFVNLSIAAALPSAAPLPKDKVANEVAEGKLNKQVTASAQPQSAIDKEAKVNVLQPVPNMVPAPTASSPVVSAPATPSNLSFYITIAVVVTAGLLNYFLSSRTMGNQTREATKSRQADHQNKVSEYRHAWLQELRNTASDLIKAIYEGRSALMRTNLSRDYRDSAKQRNDTESIK